MGLGDNTTALLMTRGLSEMARYGLTKTIVLEGDLFAPVPDHLEGRVDLIVANQVVPQTDAHLGQQFRLRVLDPLPAVHPSVEALDVARARER